MKQAYVFALTDALLASTEVDKVLKSTKELLDKKGHGRLWSAVLRGAVQELEKRTRTNTPQVIISAKAVEKTEQLKKALTELGVDSSVDFETSVDETIIGGFIVRYKDRMLDASYKRALVDLYRRVTKS